MTTENWREKMSNGKPVVITTEFRGVFFGYVKDDSDLPHKITLTKMRNCVRFQDTQGVFGLAASGPTSTCLIGPMVPEFTAWKITSVTDCTPEAAEKWEMAQWK